MVAEMPDELVANVMPHPFKPVSKEQVMEDLDASDEDIREGRVKDAHQAMKDIRVRLGMPV